MGHSRANAKAVLAFSCVCVSCKPPSHDPPNWTALAFLAQPSTCSCSPKLSMDLPVAADNYAASWVHTLGGLDGDADEEYLIEVFWHGNCGVMLRMNGDGGGNYQVMRQDIVGSTQTNNYSTAAGGVVLNAASGTASYVIRGSIFSSLSQPRFFQFEGVTSLGPASNRIQGKWVNPADKLVSLEFSSTGNTPCPRTGDRIRVWRR